MIVDDTGSAVATLLVDAGVALGTVGGTISLDESRAPHVEAKITVPMPDAATLALLDPTGPPRRVELELVARYPLEFTPDKTRTFNLGLRAAPIDHLAGAVELTLASDEALLGDDGLLSTEPLSLRPFEGSVRSIVDAVLDRIGAALEPGPADAPFRVLFDARNLLENPGADVDVSAVVSAGNSSFARETVITRTGAGSLRIGNVSAGLYAIMLDWSTSTTAGAHTVTAGDERNLSVWARGNAVHPAHLGIRWLDAAGAQIGGDVLAAPVALSTTEWRRISVAGIAPAGAARLKPIVWGDATATGAGTLMYLDDMVLADTLELVDAFDGATPDTTEYGYNWEAAAGVSRSTRLALIDRSPDSLLWLPGVDALGFLSPIVQTAGMRLFCDEARRWHLVDGATFTAAGTVVLTAPGNLHSAVDTTDRDAGEWFDAALVRYRWRRPDGTTAESIDYHASPGHSRVATFEIEAPYPGPGRAAYKVKRAAGAGRTADVAALSNLDTTPTQVLRLTLPATAQLLGVVKSVTFNLDDGTMRLVSRGLVDLGPDSWLAQTTDATWLAAPDEPWTE